VFVFTRILGIQVLHIQHEHGLHWDDNEFLHTLYAYQKQHPAVSIFVTLHSVNLAQQDRRTFYHRLAQAAHLITLNKLAVERANVPLRFIEHGVPTRFRARPAKLLMQNHVATFGFWDEAKRHDMLCEVAEDAGVAFDLFSQPPGEFGEAGCDGLVTYHRRFLDTPELITRLSEFSALIFLRRPAHEVFAVSGSARMALAAQVPVICEESPHFDDLAGAVDIVPFNRLPQRIREVVGNETLRAALVARQSAFMAQWSEEETQRMHLDLYHSLPPLEVVNAGNVGVRGALGSSSADDLDVMRIELGAESKRLAEKMNRFELSSLEMLPEESGERSGGGRIGQEREL